MSLIKHPQSPQIIISSKQDKEKFTQSLKVEKSRNSIQYEQDESITVVKQKTFQGDFSQFDNSLNQKISPNETRILLQNNANNNSLQIRNNTDDAIISISPKVCCYCGEAQNVIPICQCSQAHQNCANDSLQTGTFQEQIKCKNCNQYKHVNGIIGFDIKQWRKNKLILIFEIFLVFLILSIFGILTYFTITELVEDIAQDRILISCLVFSYTVGFILLICMITRIITHFKTIKFIIKRFDPKNIQFNKKYLSLMMEI